MDSENARRLYVDLWVSELEGARYTSDNLIAAQCTLDGIQARTPFATMVKPPGIDSFVPVWDNSNGKMSWELSEQMVARLLNHSPRFKVQIFLLGQDVNQSARELIGFTVHDFRTILNGKSLHDRNTSLGTSESIDQNTWTSWCPIHSDQSQGVSAGKVKISFSVRWSNQQSLQVEPTLSTGLSIPGAVPDGDHIRIGSYCHNAHTFTLAITLLRTSDLTPLFSKKALADCRRKDTLFFLSYSLFDVDVCSNAFTGLITPHLDCIRDTFKLRGSLEDVLLFLSAAPIVVHLYGIPRRALAEAMQNPRPHKPLASAVVDFGALCKNMQSVDETRVVSGNASGAFPFVNPHVVERQSRESSARTHSSVAVDLALLVDDPGTPPQASPIESAQHLQRTRVTLQQMEMQGMGPDAGQARYIFELLASGTATGPNPVLQSDLVPADAHGTARSASAAETATGFVTIHPPELEGRLVVQCRKVDEGFRGPVVARAVVSPFQVLKRTSSPQTVAVALYSTVGQAGQVCGKAVLAMELPVTDSSGATGNEKRLSENQLSDADTDYDEAFDAEGDESLHGEAEEGGATQHQEMADEGKSEENKKAGEEKSEENIKKDEGKLDDAELNQTRGEEVHMQQDLEDDLTKEEDQFDDEFQFEDDVDSHDIHVDIGAELEAWGVNPSRDTRHFELKLILGTIRGLSENSNIYVQYHNSIAGTRLVRSQPPILVSKHGERLLPRNGSLQVVLHLTYDDLQEYLSMVTPICVQVWHKDQYLEDQQLGVCAIPISDIFQQDAKYLCGNRTFLSYEHAQQFVKEAQEDLEAQTRGGSTTTSRTAQRAAARLKKKSELPIVRIQQLSLSLPVNSFDARGAKQVPVQNLIRHEAFMTVEVRLEDHGAPRAGELERPRQVAKGAQLVAGKQRVARSAAPPAETPHGEPRDLGGDREARHAPGEQDLLRAKRELEHRAEVEGLQAALAKQDEVVRQLRSESEAQLAYFEKNWAIREYERVKEVEAAKGEYSELHERLRRALQDAEKRERAVRALEGDLRTAHERKAAETDILMRRLREDHAHKLQLQKERAQALDQRLKQAGDQVARANQRAQRAEADLEALRESVRRSPEAQLQQQIAALRGELQAARLATAQERSGREAEAHAKERMRARVFQLARELQRYKEEEGRGAQRQLEQLKLEYLAREEQFVLGGEREELRSIRAEMEALRVAAARQEFFGGGTRPAPREPLGNSDRSSGSEESGPASPETPTQSRSVLSGVQKAAAKDLKRLMGEREDLKQSLGPSHPVMQQLERHIQAARQVLAGN